MDVQQANRYYQAIGAFDGGDERELPVQTAASHSESDLERSSCEEESTWFEEGMKKKE